MFSLLQHRMVRGNRPENGNMADLNPLIDA